MIKLSTDRIEDSMFSSTYDVDPKQLDWLPFSIDVKPIHTARKEQWESEIIWSVDKTVAAPTEDDPEAVRNTTREDAPGYVLFWDRAVGRSFPMGGDDYFNARRFRGKTIREVVEKATKAAWITLTEVLVQSAEQGVSETRSVRVP